MNIKEAIMYGELVEIKGEDAVVYGKVIEEKQSLNGILHQIVMTNECGGRYYLVSNGVQGFHSLNLDRVKSHMNGYL